MPPTHALPPPPPCPRLVVPRRNGAAAKQEETVLPMPPRLIDAAAAYERHFFRHDACLRTVAPRPALRAKRPGMRTRMAQLYVRTKTARARVAAKRCYVVVAVRGDEDARHVCRYSSAPAQHMSQTL